MMFLILPRLRYDISNSAINAEYFLTETDKNNNISGSLTVGN